MRLEELASPQITATDNSRGTVLFADLRGYTGMAERLRPRHLALLLDEFFNVLTAVTEEHGGSVYHTAGDSLMAGFGIESHEHEGAAQALAAGCAMMLKFATLAARWEREAQVQAGLGVGLHSGEIALARFGPASRRIETLVGDTANVAARLCSRARAGEVLFSCTVAGALQEQILRDGAFLQLPRFEVRGRREPLDIWCMPAPERRVLPGFEVPGAGNWQ